MSKRRNKSATALLRVVLLLGAVALVAFGAGELWRLSHSDGWRLRLARFGWGDRARVVQLIGRQLRHGLEAAGVPRDSVHESVPDDGAVAVRWRIGLPPGGSALQVNYAITRALEQGGAEVLDGREGVGPKGEPVVTLRVGLPKRATHELVLALPGHAARPAEPAAAAEPEPARLALVLFGFGDDPEHAADCFRLPHPFAVAVVPGAPWSSGMFRAARAAQREVVLHLPLEPVNYPSVDPGPGTVLVTMEPARITGLVRRYLDTAGPVSAVANHMGSLATQDMEVMSAVYRELRRRNVPFLHVQPAPGSVCRSLAASEGVVYREPDVVLDAETRARDPRTLEKRWSAVLERARERGRLVVFVRDTPLARRWLPGALTAKRLDGVSVVPVASLLKKGAAL